MNLDPQIIKENINDAKNFFTNELNINFAKNVIIPEMIEFDTCNIIFSGIYLYKSGIIKIYSFQTSKIKYGLKRAIFHENFHLLTHFYGMLQYELS